MTIEIIGRGATRSEIPKRDSHLRWYHSTAVIDPDKLLPGDSVWDLHTPDLWQPWFTKLPEYITKHIQQELPESWIKSQLKRYVPLSISMLSKHFKVPLESTPSIMIGFAVMFYTGKDVGTIILNGIDLSVVGTRRKQRDNILVCAGIAIANGWKLESTNDMFTFKNYLS